MDSGIMTSSLDLVGKEIGDTRVGHPGSRSIPFPEKFLVFIAENVEVSEYPWLLVQSGITKLADEMSELKAHPLSLCSVDNRLIDMESQKQCLTRN
jgi:hypothetical protein